MRCELYVRLMLSLVAPLFGACEAILARRTAKGPTGFVRDRAVAEGSAEAKGAALSSARVLSPSRPTAQRSGPTQSVRLHFFCPPRGSDPAFGICASLSCAS